MQNTIPVAVVGAGRFGRKHVEKYVLDARASLVAIVDPDPALESLARHHGVRWFPSVDDVPAGLVRAASVAVPNAAHYATSAALLRAGVDVLVEKPFTMRLDEADELIEMARRGERILQVGHVERFNPAVLALQPRALAFERVRAVRCGPLPESDAPPDVVLDLMIHDIELVLHWAAAQPEHFTVRGESARYPTIDRAQATLHFPGGAVAELTAERGAPWRMLDVVARGGRLRIDCLGRRAHDGDTPLEVPPHDALAAEIAAFLDAVRRRSAPIVTAHDGRGALDVALRIRERIFAARYDPAA
ncbi:MAG TPA: Gfo/Idh/MocA family oxidoreductase [Xanthomonadales bacterium]|nr:Gfo/Idh/MocA family oxidoreductase [Xanthomonadales bacterium]